ncbi:MAG: hypothetical protein SFW36_11360 [Leptolyngbyaceae cyanobacterium bins.59]|nr:hypothetical protein [Leptolyngbyaceae cyanobacterium bins.59]
MFLNKLGSKADSLTSDSETSRSDRWLKKIRGGVLFAIGFMLSPLSWWNDLIFNLPVAYGFGYLCSLISSNWLIPGMIIGYWLSNIVGILLMQAGVLDLAQGQVGKRNFKKELLTGLISSTVYTLIIVGLLQFKILETPALFASEQWGQVSSWLHW